MTESSLYTAQLKLRRPTPVSFTENILKCRPKLFILPKQSPGSRDIGAAVTGSSRDEFFTDDNRISASVDDKGGGDRDWRSLRR